MPAEYDPDADPLMGRLVSVRASRVAPPRPSSSSSRSEDDKWLNGVILYCDTVELDDGTEVGTPNYRMLYGNFKSMYHALRTKRSTQRVSCGTDRTMGGERTRAVLPFCVAKLARYHLCSSRI